MGINAGRVDATGIFLGASDGRTVEVTRQQIVDFYATTTGSVAARRQQTIDWVKGRILAVFGDLLLLEQLDVDLDASRAPSRLIVRNDL